MTNPEIIKGIKNGKPNARQRKAIKEYNKMLQRVGSHFVPGITDDGEGILGGASCSYYSCGCNVVGGGTTDFPLEVRYCKLHSPETVRRLVAALEIAHKWLTESTLEVKVYQEPTPAVTAALALAKGGGK